MLWEKTWSWKGFLKRYLLILLFLLVIQAFQMKNDAVENTLKEAPQLDVSYQLNGNDLSLDVQVDHFDLTLENMGKENKFGEDHIHIYLDGKKVAKIFKPSYVLRDIPEGKHTVKVELAHNNHENYGIGQEIIFQVDQAESS
ncbi:MAG: hypothetical protein H0Z33_05230 [Bacillaceae bacterium]|nr:hypothetical protein [Bacillaceae bacterium]